MQPVQTVGGLAVLRGNLAPDGAVIKPTAADPTLLKHTGKAVVFEDYNDMAARIDAESLEVDAGSVLVLRNAGPLGGPGMPEWGMLPIPKKLLKQGVRDMVRISDARMSGTSYGCCVLHVAPESFVGGRARAGPDRGPDRAGRIRAQTRSQGKRGRTLTSPRGVAPAHTEISARLRRLVPGQYLPGQRGVRLPVSRGNCAHTRAGDPLRRTRFWPAD